MTVKKTLKKKVGFIALIFAALCWITAPLLTQYDIPAKVFIISSVVVIGEILFVLAIIFLGKEHWGKIKNYFNPFRKKIKSKFHEEKV